MSVTKIHYYTNNNTLEIVLFGHMYINFEGFLEI